MQFTGTYDKTLYRDDYSGMTIFSFIPETSNITLSKYGTIVCKGCIQLVPPGTSLVLECSQEYDGKGREYYTISNYDFAINGAKAVERFLTSISFKGVGKATIKKISEKYPDLFLLINDENNIEILRSFKIKYENAQQMIKTLKNMYNVKDIFNALFKYNVSYESIYRIYNYIEDRPVGFIFQNPFILLKANVPYATCEKIAFENGIKPTDPVRIVALLKYAYECLCNYGHTKVTFTMLAKKCIEIEHLSNSGCKTSPFFLAGFLNKANLIISKDNEISYIYDRDLYEKEKEIAREIRRIGIKTNEIIPITDEQILEIEKKNKIKYAEKQKEAFHLIESPGIKILTGGPGTGKTTVINGLITAFQTLYPNKKVALCAPTGCAAKQMTYATGVQAYTIHKLLGIMAFGDTYIQSINRNNRLEADFIIVDESSMIDTDLMYMLVQAIKNHSILLLVGDEDQLPSVGKGNILHDLLNSDLISSCRLNQVFRQKDTSLIVENSVYIRNGEIDSLKEGEDYQIIKLQSEKDLKEKALSLIKEYWTSDSPFAVKIFSPVKNFKYDLSTSTLNNIMHDYYIDEKDEVLFGYRKFSKGDPVIFTINNYEMGYFNGDTGIITAIITENNRKILEVTTDDGVYYLTMSNWKDLELAYAITTHKSQGSECEIAIIILPTKPENMLTKSLLYVATTRAKKKNIILVQDNALEKAISNNSDTKRLTGLKERISEAFSEKISRCA